MQSFSGIKYESGLTRKGTIEQISKTVIHQDAELIVIVRCQNGLYGAQRDNHIAKKLGGINDELFQSQCLRSVEDSANYISIASNSVPSPL